MENKQLISIVILLDQGLGDGVFRKLFHYLERQKLPNQCSLEYIVVNSGEKQKIFSKKIKLIPYNQDCYKFGLARDIGFFNSRGEVVITMSKDILPTNRYLISNLITPILNDRYDVIQGNCIVPQDFRVFYWEKIKSFYFTKESKGFKRNNGKIGLSCVCLAMKRKVWEDNKFRSPYLEDKYFQKKIFNSSYSFQKAENACFYHGHSYNLRELLYRCINEGFGWRFCGIQYNLKEMVGDLLNINILKKMVTGLISRQIRSISEFLFPIIRPICIFLGLRRKCNTKQIVNNKTWDLK